MLPNPFTIDWNNHTTGQWDRMLRACKRPTLPQTWQYAAAKAGTTGEVADNGIIQFHGKPVGLVQVERRRLIGPFAHCAIYRGPIWVYDTIPNQMHKIVLRILRQRYATYRGKTLVFHPELPDNQQYRDQLHQCGFTRVDQGYSTAWLDLERDTADIRRGLRQKWRHSLHQAERHRLTAEPDATGAHLDWLLDRYAADMAERSYVGPSTTLIRNLHKVGQPVGMIQTLRAMHDREPVAGVILARHGRAATYLVGWNSDRGRELRAHHLLLWKAAQQLKAQGTLWFDLGGHNDEGAASIARFKQGLGGTPTTLVGTYR